MAIVLPQGVFSNSTQVHVRDWVLKHCQVLAVVGLHPFTFLPHTGTKTSILFLRKLRGPSDQDYPVLFAVSDEPGKDSKGQFLYDEKPVDGVPVRFPKHDLVKIAQAFRGFAASEGLGFSVPVADSDMQYDNDWFAEHVSVRQFSDIRKTDRLDAEFWQPRLLALEDRLRRHSSGSIRGHVAPRVQRYKKGAGAGFMYLDISSVDRELGMAIPSETSADDAPSRAQYIVRPGDVLVSTVRPSRNTVALVDTAALLPHVASSGFCVLRPEDVVPEYLFAYCKTRHFRDLLTRFESASMYPAVSDNDVLEMPLFDANRDTVARVKRQVSEAFACMRKARQLIQDAVRTVEEAIESKNG